MNKSSTVYWEKASHDYNLRKINNLREKAFVVIHKATHPLLWARLRSLALVCPRILISLSETREKLTILECRRVLSWHFRGWVKSPGQGGGRKYIPHWLSKYRGRPAGIYLFIYLSIYLSTMQDCGPVRIHIDAYWLVLLDPYLDLYFDWGHN